MKDTLASVADPPWIVDVWLEERRSACDMHVAEIPRSLSKEWTLEGGRIAHHTGGFFSIVGTRVSFSTGVSGQDLPLISQPEIGILGFVVRRSSGQQEILLQAKPEPGNIGLVQIAPSVQATESNYRRRHGGKPTPLLELFLAGNRSRTLSSSLQSEQGSRFLGKYNRNVIVDAGRSWSEPPSPALSWFAVEELQPLLLYDFAVNTDARSVLATAPWSTLASDGQPFRRWRRQGGFGEALLESFAPGIEEPLQVQRDVEKTCRWLSEIRQRFPFGTMTVPLHSLQGWRIEDRSIHDANKGVYGVRHYRIETSEREVESWDQPLVVAPGEGTATLLCQYRCGILRFLFSGRAEPGLRECVQLGPTVQFIEGPGEIFSELESRDRTLAAIATNGVQILSSLHSDEGGRCFNCISRYSVVEIPEDDSLPDFDTSVWLTLAEISLLVRFQGVFTNEARTLVSLLLAFA